MRRTLSGRLSEGPSARRAQARKQENAASRMGKRMSTAPCVTKIAQRGKCKLLPEPVVARASRLCVGCTIRTGGTPVPLRWKRRGRRNYVCLSMCQACEWLNTYGGEGESFSARRTIRTRRLSNARCAPFPLPEGPERECVRERGNGAASH